MKVFPEKINFEGQRYKNLYNIMIKQFDLSLCHLFVTSVIHIFMKTVVEYENQKAE